MGNTTKDEQPQRLALVLSGGGARGAYEAGVIHYIRTALPDKALRGRNFEVQCGSSVGAINTCFMASHAHAPLEQGQKIYRLWKDLKQEQIYSRNLGALGSLLARTTKSIGFNLFNLNPFDPDRHRHALAHFKGFLDTTPLTKFLPSIIPFQNIAKNLKAHILSAVSVTATNVSTGRMELFIQKRPNVHYTGDYTHTLTELKATHIMASAAIPLIFPAVPIQDTYYIDGGLKLNTPMSPAIQLGANRIMLIGSHHIYQAGEKLMWTSPAHEQPSLGQLVGQIMNALFLGRLQYDMEQLGRINRLIDWSEKVYGADYLQKINAMLSQEGIRGDIANRGLKKIKVLHIFPSRDISELFARCYEDDKAIHKSFSAFEKMLLRLLDIDPVAGVDILSYLGFLPNYIKSLLELGFEDAAAHRDEILDFLGLTD